MASQLHDYMQNIKKIPPHFNEIFEKFKKTVVQNYNLIFILFEKNNEF